MKIAGRYKTTGRTDAGGMGEIIECEDLHLKRRVIIKRLQAGVEPSRLIDEQRALARLRSKHVVQLYDVVEIKNCVGELDKAIVLEFIEGESLSKILFNTDKEYLKILWQISCGLSDIHEAKIIHRDIKPENIMLNSDNIIKIIDFGLARSNDSAKTRSIIGTPIFMAPELWDRRDICFDSSIDVYAFGVTALALLSDSLPQKLRRSPPLPISMGELADHVENIQQNVLDLIHSCLNRAPRCRPCMLDVQALLSRHLLKEQHRALVVLDGRTYFLDNKNRKIKLDAEGLGSISIKYDGYDFKVFNSSGKVFLNNNSVHNGDLVPGCCVITFGADGNRRFVTFDVSTPEMMA